MSVDVTPVSVRDPVADGGRQPAPDPLGLARYLDASDRFHRDSFIGRILHPGTLSFRERVVQDSVHILIDGTTVSLHVDRYAPLVLSRRGPARYSFWRAAVHNLVHLAEDAVRLLTGRRGEHRCVLDCRRVDTGDAVVDELLDRSPSCDDRGR